MIKHRIDKIYTEVPFYGSRKITAQLRREGILTCRETVRQYMILLANYRNAKKRRKN